MRPALLLAAISLTSAPALADKPAAFQLYEDGALGTQLPGKRVLDGSKGMDSRLDDCITGAPAAMSSALFWLEIKGGSVTAAKVHGTGSSALDSCLAGALKKAVVTEKLPGSTVLVGRLDVLDKNKNLGNYLPSPKVSEVAVLLDAKGGSWQLATRRFAYIDNRAADISQALDAQTAAIDACAAKRVKSSPEIEMVAWLDGGMPQVRGTGDSAFDSCLAGALSGLKLPTATSALWMELSLKHAAEPLAPRTDKDRPALSKDQALKDALATAVRARKDALLDCVDGKKSKLTKLTVALAGGKANVKAVSTGDATADACVKTKFVDVAIKSADPADKLELEVALDQQ